METGDDCHRTHPCYALFFRFRILFLEELGLLVKEDRKSHVLWNGSVGSMAYCCADRVFSMSILFDAGDIHDNSCWNSCFTN